MTTDPSGPSGEPERASTPEDPTLEVGLPHALRDLRAAHRATATVPGAPVTARTLAVHRLDPQRPGHAALPGDTATGTPADRVEADLPGIHLVTDRGISHSRNEDAVAAEVLTDTGHGPATVVAVCDGVSSSRDPQRASAAASRAGTDAMTTALRAGRSAAEAAFAGLAAASDAVHEVSQGDGHDPSCTYVAAIVRPHTGGAVEITVANVGDSRAYWLRHDDIADDDEHAGSRRLTTDDSFAQALVDAGAMDEDAAMRDPRAHTLLRWLGVDAGPRPWSDTGVRAVRVTGPGVLLVCSDGLWNYRPHPAELARMIAGTDPAGVARALADFAVHCGGNDNITIAVVPIPAPDGVQ